MNINLNTISKHAVIFFKEKVNSLTAQQKRILIIACAIFSCLTLCYAMRQNCFKAKKPRLEKEKLKRGNFLPVLKKPVLKKTDRLQDFAKLIHISVFSMLDLKSWCALSQVNKYFKDLSKNSLVSNFLLTKGFIPQCKKLEFAKLANLSLIKLDLEDPDYEETEITDQELINVLARCPNIQELNFFAAYKLTEQAIRYLPSNLQSLNLTYCNFRAAALVYLPSSLKSLDLTGNPLTDILFNCLPNDLHTLNLTSCNKITDSVIQYLPPNLRSLNLSSCESLTEAALNNLPSTLQFLNLTDWFRLTGAALNNLPSTLQFLNLSFCARLTDAAFNNLPSTLKSLDLTGCILLTDAVLAKLPSTLIFLDVTGCMRLTESAINQLAKKIPTIKGFRLEIDWRK